MDTANRGLARWYWVHKWSSLICTAFVLLACITGLPLVFAEELDSLGHAHAGAADESSWLDFDTLLQRVQAARPQAVPQFVIREPTTPGITVVGMGKRVDAPLVESEQVQLDNATGEILAAGGEFDGVLGVLAQLHIELFAGQLGTLFLGLMTVFLLIALISGVVIYVPFMGNRTYERPPARSSQRQRWSWLHNGLGMVLAVWLFTVALTGAINTVGAPIIQLWLMTGVRDAVASDTVSVEANATLSSFEQAYRRAARQLPDSDFYFAMFPGTEFSSDRHYLIFQTGRSPLASRLFKPVIVNGYSGEFVGAPEFPWYLKALLLSQPLHFGDYGGLTLKIAWFVLDVGAIVLLWSGVALWLRRRRARHQQHGVAAAPAQGVS
ncbi:MAG: PepSY-associated TM helix domain-containing protein [Pseudomonadota bacterium]